MKSEKGKLMRKLLMIGVLMMGAAFTGPQFNTNAGPSMVCCSDCDSTFDQCVEGCYAMGEEGDMGQCWDICQRGYNQCSSHCIPCMLEP